jgi:hypothetical protein
VERAASEAWTDARAVPVLRLEREIVEVHRHAAPRPVPEAGRYRLSPDKRLHRAARGTADLHEAIHAVLARAPGGLAQAVLEPDPPLPDRAVDPDRTESLLLELVRDDGPRVRFAVGAAEITPALFSLLRHAGTPRTRVDLVARVRALGAGAREAPEVVDGLIADGTILSVV